MATRTANALTEYHVKHQNIKIILPCQTLCVKSPNTPPVVGCGCTPRPLPSTRGQKHARMRRVLKLQTKLAFHWTGPHKVCAVRPPSAERTSDALPFGHQAPRSEPQPGYARRCISVACKKACADASGSGGIAKIVTSWILDRRSTAEQLCREVPSTPYNGRRRSRAFAAPGCRTGP